VREGDEADEREGGLDNRDDGREDVQMGIMERCGWRIDMILE